MSAPIPPKITIIGAGLSGLTLALCLKNKGIPATIYDRATTSQRYNYGISLQPAVFRPLANLLQLDESTFREKTFIDPSSGNTFNNSDVSLATISSSLRCHRGRLEALLGENLQINRDKTLREIRYSSHSRELTALFEDGFSQTSDYIVGCDGPHSKTRQSLSPNLNLEVLPYVVFNGKRRMSHTEYDRYIKKHLTRNTVIETLKGQVHLEVSLSNVSESHIDVSYIYSRPAKEDGDPLHRPERPNNVASASDIPQEFFKELDELGALESPFDVIFDAAKVRNDRLLHWLMRALKPSLLAIEKLVDHGVLLIGDAAHATPILGGEGANLAVRDGIELAEHIASHGVRALGDFAKSKIEAWDAAVKDSKTRIEKMHSPAGSQL